MQTIEVKMVLKKNNEEKNVFFFTNINGPFLTDDDVMDAITEKIEKTEKTENLEPGRPDSGQPSTTALRHSNIAGVRAAGFQIFRFFCFSWFL